MNLQLYILDKDNQMVPVDNTVQWAQWYVGPGPIVKHTHLKKGSVTTLFLGFDQALGQGAPRYWANVVLGASEQLTLRQEFSTLDEALAGHAEAVELAEITAPRSAKVTSLKLATHNQVDNSSFRVSGGACDDGPLIA